ncbi:MAG: hypothetical protein UT37_C0009G0007 [Parcubacteria group bacterium GW2011_GWA2_39_18]|nr:MAG: hypothetical protein UT37_C0009G0007 [Parcubacteria group bacterium GW2011_GWA2_39_18]
MPILSIRDANFIKLKSLKKEYLREFCDSFAIQSSADMTEMIRRILSAFDDSRISSEQINQYIKNIYSQIRDQEIATTGADHTSIVEELNKVDSHIWGMVQGTVDAYIQTNYVRKYFRFDDIIRAIRGSLYNVIEAYTLCTWYNHWSTVFLEDLICLNSNVVPIIKKVKGVDIIWNGQPVDIKVTNLPKEWLYDGKTIDDAINDPVLACEYLYRLQGAQRFGSENRLFIITHNRENPSESWKIKRDYPLVKRLVSDFFDQNVQLDPVNFSFNSTQYLAHAKVMFIIK